MYDHPIRLCADQWTSPSRTPWGGRKILKKYKTQWAKRHPKKAQKISMIGESWEVSLDPDFSSKICQGPLLIDALKAFTKSILGNAERLYGPMPLIKLLDAAWPLSVQVHPRDGDPQLKPDQCGKSEAWYILEAEPGAGIYLGLEQQMSVEILQQKLEQKAFGPKDLHFEAVQPGQLWIVKPGVIHAIGAGVTLLEAQIVRPEKRAQTYRLWDWDRKYSAEGLPDPEGFSRPLHIEQALNALDLDFLHGEKAAYLSKPKILEQHKGHWKRVDLGSMEEMKIQRLEGEGKLKFSTENQMWTITVLKGRCFWNESTEMHQGESWILPASMPPADVILDRCLAIMTEIASKPL